MSADPPDWPPDLPGYRLLRCIGRGAYGEVWIARTAVTGLYRAVKLIRLEGTGDPPEDQHRRRVADRVSRGLQAYLQRIPPGSPAALTVLHVHEDPAGRFLAYVMELADDVSRRRDFAPESYEPLTLTRLCRRAPAGMGVSRPETTTGEERIAPGGRLLAPTVVELGVQLAAGLAELHAAGLLHNDIKPDNIVFISGQPRLADIDLVRPIEATRTVSGTPGYRPDLGAFSPSGDIYGLGMTLFVALSGQSPGPDPMLEGDWDSWPDFRTPSGFPLLPELNQVLRRACALEPARRQASALQLKEELQLLAAGESVVERGRWLARLQRARRIAAVAVPVSLLAVAGAWFQSRQAAVERALRQTAEAAETRSAFNLYRADLDRAATAIRDDRYGDARRWLEAEQAARDRGPEWDWLWHQAAGDAGRSLGSFGQTVERLAFSPDGKHLVAVLAEVREARVFDWPDPRPPMAITNLGRFAGFLDNGRHLAGSTRLQDGGIGMGIWTLAEGILDGPPQPAAPFPAGVLQEQQAVTWLDFYHPGRLVKWHPGRPEPLREIHWASLPDTLLVSSVEWDVPGRRLLLVSAQQDTNVWLALGEPDRSPADIEALPGVGIRAALSPDGSRLALTTQVPGTLGVGPARLPWTPEQTVANLAEPNAIAWHPSKPSVAVATGTEVGRFDATTLEQRTRTRGHGATVTALAWSPDGRWLASGDQTGEIRVWPEPPAPDPDARAGFLGLGNWPLLAVSSDENLAAISRPGNQMALVDLADLSVRWSADGLMTPLAFDPAAAFVTALDPDQGVVRLAVADGSGLGRTPPIPSPPEGLHAALVRPANHGLVLISTRGRVNTVRLPEGRLETDWAGVAWAAEAAPRNWAVSDDGRWLATVGNREAGGVGLWDLSSGRRVASVWEGAVREQFREESGPFSAVFTADGRSLVLGGPGGQLLALSLPGLAPVEGARLPTPLDRNYVLAAATGGRLVAGGPDGRLAVIRTRDAAELLTLTHRSLPAGASHAVVRLQVLTRTGDLLALTETGWLLRWRGTGRR